MNDKIRVLIFPCGKENGLELYNALKFSFHLEVFGASSVRDHGIFAYENYIGDVPFINDKEFISHFNKIIQTHKIDVVLPTHDTVAVFFAEQADKINAKIVVPDKQVAQICRNKALTYQLFKDEDFVPKIYSNIEDIPPFDFPLFLKPTIGEGSKNSARCKDISEVKQVLSNGLEYIVSQFLPGEELTVDCFTDRKHELKFIGPRLRNRVNMGISFNSTRHPVTEEIKHIAETINKRLDFRGLWYFQLKKDNQGKYKLLEISCRAAGTMIFYRILGINFALMSIFDLLGYDIDILFNDLQIELDRCIKNRFKINYGFRRIYIDFDDTIIVRNKVNDIAIQFIYQMINNKKEIILLTRHDGNLSETLEQFRISENLFDKIIHLNFDIEKADYIEPEESIFIDNAFHERKKVFQKYGIPVFDVDAIEAFII